MFLSVGHRKCAKNPVDGQKIWVPLQLEPVIYENFVSSLFFTRQQKSPAKSKKESMKYQFIIISD